MSTLDAMDADIVGCLGDPMFGEDIGYSANGAVSVSVRAFIYRHGFRFRGARHDAAAGSMQPEYDREILIRRADVPVVTPKADTVTLANNYSETKSAFRVMAILKSDPVAWHLGIKK